MGNPIYTQAIKHVFQHLSLGAKEEVVTELRAAYGATSDDAFAEIYYGLCGILEQRLFLERRVHSHPDFEDLTDYEDGDPMHRILAASIASELNLPTRLVKEVARG